MSYKIEKDLKVSVIIPLYNQKEYVSEAIESVLSQNYKNIELIVVNDGSTDNPDVILNEFKDKLRVINQKNRGPSNARNTGLKNSSGEFVQFLDADDILAPEKIEEQMNFNLKVNADISYCEISVIDGKHFTEMSLKTGYISDLFNYYYLLWKPYPTPIHSLLIKRKLFEKFGYFNETLRANEDRFYFNLMAAKGVKFHYINIIGGFYRIHEKSANRNTSLMISSALQFYRKINPILGDDLILEKTGFKGEEILRANMTYLYFTQIRKGFRRGELKKILDIIHVENIEWFADPLPSSFKRNKLFMMKISAYFWRYLRLLGFKKKSILEL